LSGNVRRVASDSPPDTERVGAEIAVGLRRGDVVVVAGALGTGKTTLVRGALRALGVEAPVTSPTFTVGARYRGRVNVSHLDLYRLEDLDAEEPGLLDDYLTPDAVTFIEWPPDGGDAFDPAVRVEIEHAGGDRRRITITPSRKRGG
jgi:tRNA threonylcarbamoyladenosine biosynthesis protein TsaE